jgi:hypothetical protein
VSVGIGAPASARAGASRSSLTRRAAALLVVSGVLAGGLSALLAPGGQSGPSAPPARLVAVPAAEAAPFAILRRPRTPADAFHEIDPGLGPMGANPALARTVREPAGGLSLGFVSVVPARGGVCLRIPFAGGATWWCQPTAKARVGSLRVGLRPPSRLGSAPPALGNQLLIGLVPDGVRSVTVTSTGGAERRLPVRANLYDAQVYSPRRVAFELAGARVSVSAP